MNRFGGKSFLEAPFSPPAEITEIFEFPFIKQHLYLGGVKKFILIENEIAEIQRNKIGSLNSAT